MFLYGNIEEGAIDGRLKDDIMILFTNAYLHNLLQVLLQVLFIFLNVLASSLHVGNEVVAVGLEVEPLQLVAFLQEEASLSVPEIVLGFQLNRLFYFSLVEGDTGDSFVFDVNCKRHSNAEGRLRFERLHDGPAQVLIDLVLSFEVLDAVLIEEYLLLCVDLDVLSGEIGYLELNVADVDHLYVVGLFNDVVLLLLLRLALQPV